MPGEAFIHIAACIKQIQRICFNLSSMMQPFVFHTPTRINFGEGTACGIGDVLFELRATRPLLVTDANLLKAGVLELYTSLLPNNSCDMFCIGCQSYY